MLNANAQWKRVVEIREVSVEGKDVHVLHISNVRPFTR